MLTLLQGKLFLVISKTIISLFTNQLYLVMNSKAEKFNGWAAMIGFVAAIGAYATTGQIIPGIF